MKYYPVNLNIRNQPCLVVGGGSVGTRKVRTLLACGAQVTVVSPDTADELTRLAGSGEIRLKQRTYEASDLETMFLVIGATDDENLNRQIHTDAEGRNMLCNIADRPEICNFILPSLVSRGDLLIAISTSGTSPAFAKKLRKKLEKQFGNEYARFLKLMGAVRAKLLRQAHEPEAHKHLFEQLIDKGLLALVRQGDDNAINALLFEVLGEGYTIKALIQTDS